MKTKMEKKREIILSFMRQHSGEWLTSKEILVMLGEMYGTHLPFDTAKSVACCIKGTGKFLIRRRYERGTVTEYCLPSLLMNYSKEFGKALTTEKYIK